jgi:hypothetical protein
METTKEKVLKLYPNIEERVSYRLKPFGKKGHAGLEGVLELWMNGVFLCQHTSTKSAYLKAKRIIENRYGKPT